MNKKKRILKEVLQAAFEEDMKNLLKESEDLPEYQFSEDFELKMKELIERV